MYISGKFTPSLELQENWVPVSFLSCSNLLSPLTGGPWCHNIVLYKGLHMKSCPTLPCFSEPVWRKASLSPLFKGGQQCKKKKVHLVAQGKEARYSAFWSWYFKCNRSSLLPAKCKHFFTWVNPKENNQTSTFSTVCNSFVNWSI